MKVARLGELVEIKGGGTPDKANPLFWGGDIPWASVKDFKSATLGRTTDFITEAGVRGSATNVIPTGTIVVPTRMAVGKVAVTDRPIAINQDLKALLIKGPVDQRYLLRALSNFGPELERQATGATVKGITLSVLQNLVIPLPCLTEQRGIAEILDQADEIRCKSRAMFARLKDLRQAIFYDMFGDLAAETTDYARLHLGDLLADKMRSGAYYPKEMYTQKSGVPMVHMSDVFGGIVDPKIVKRVKVGQEAQRYNLNVNDILIARRSINFDGAAKPCRIPTLDEPLIFESSLIRLRPNLKRLNPVFLFYYLSGLNIREKFVLPFVTRSTISGINQDGLGQVLIATPKVDHQNLFAKRIEQVERRMVDCQRYVNLADSLFSALEHRVFRGQL